MTGFGTIGRLFPSRSCESGDSYASRPLSISSLHFSPTTLSRRIKRSESCALGPYFLWQPPLLAIWVIADGGMDSFASQILPRQIRMHKGYGDSARAAPGTIVDDFHSPHGTAGGEVESSGFESDEITYLLIESFLASRTSDPSDALRSNSHRVHHPENRERFAAFWTGGNKIIVHKAFFLPDFSARSNSSGEKFLEK